MGGQSNQELKLHLAGRGRVRGRSSVAARRSLTPNAFGSDYDEALETLDVGEQDRLLLRILRGTSDANIPFDGLCYLLRRLGFAERIRGSHHIFTKEGIEEILNLQPRGRRRSPTRSSKYAVSFSNTALEEF